MEKMIQLLRKALLVSLVAAFVLLCAAGCQNNQSGGAISAVSEEDFLTKLADSSVQEITLSGDLVLTSPVEVTGSKTLLGTGTVTTAVQDMEGEYLISLASGAELTLGGDVVIDASGVIGGIHVGKDASWILQDNAVVKNASEEAANALVEGTFRMDGGALTDAKGHNLYNKNETVIAGGSITGSGAKFAGVYNEGKLTQDGGTISGAYNNIVVTDGALFDWNSGVNQDSVRDGVFVYAGAKLFVGNKEAQLLNSGARGIVLFGDATIDGITLKSSGDTQLKIAKGADLTLNGGVISEGNYHGVDNAGTMLMTGGDIFSNNDTGIVNTGTLEVTGGGIMTNGEKGIVNKHAGNAKVVSEDVTISGNRVAIGNEDTAIFELAKANILQSGNANIYAYDGEMYIHDIALNASASNNIRVMIADVTLKNVEIKGNTSAGSASTHGLLLEGGTVYGENVTISNTTGSGIRNKGGYLEGKNFTFKKIGQVAINTLDQDVTGRPGSTIIDGMTTEEAGYMNILSGGTGLIDVKNAVLCATPSNNVRANSGTVKLTNVEILGHSDKATTSHHGVYLEGGEIIANNVSIVNTKGHAIRNKGGAFTGYGVYIDGVNGDTAISNTVLADGSTGPITLYNVSIYNVKSKNIVNEAGTTYVYNSTLSPTPGSNIKITGGGVVLNNVNIQGSSAEAQGTIHAIILENGYGTLTADNVTIRNGKTSAIRNKTGLVNVTNLTVEGCGSAAIWNGNDAELKLEGETNINGLEVTGCANSFTVDAGKVTVKTATLGPATTNNVRVNGGSLHMEQVEVQGHVEGSAANIHGIYVPGGTLTAVDLTVNNTSGSALRIAGGNMTAKNVVLTDIGQAGVNSSGGVTEITGLKTTNVTSTNIVAGGSVTEDGKTVEAVVKITDGDLCKVTDAHNVKVTQYGTVELNKVSVNGAAVVKDNRYGIIAEGGAVKLTDVAIKDIDYSAIHANKETSIIEGTNVTVDGAAYAITGSNGKVTIDKLTTSNVVLGNVNVSGGAFALSNSELAKTTSDSTDSVTGHNIKSTGTAVVTLNKVDVLGTTEAAHAILAEGGDVVLNEVTIADAGNAGIRVNEETSTVTGKNVTIDTVSVDAVSVANGSVEIDGLTTKAVKAANIVAGTNDLNTGEATSGGTVKISNAELCKPTGDAHSVKAEGTAVVELNNVKVNGTSSASKYAVMAQGGDVKLTDVTIKDCAKSAIHANRDTSVIEGKNIVIEDAAYGITGSAGEITLDTLTASNVTYHNVDTSGVDVAISNATIGKTLSTSADETTAHSVKTTGGTVTLTNVDVLGTTESAHAILAEGGDVVLTDVKISEAGNAGIRINRGTSSVTGENVSIDGAVSAITGDAGAVEITNLTTAGILGGNNLLAESSCSIKVTDGDLCKTTNAHNVKTTTGAEIELNNVTVRGTAKTSGTDRHAVFSEGGDIVLNDVTIMDAQHTAVRINNALGSITGEKVDVQNAFEGITATNGSVNLKTVTIDQTSNTAVNATTGSIEIDGLTTTNVATGNILAGQNMDDASTAAKDDHEIPYLGGTIKITNGDLCKPTSGHNVRSYGNATVSLIDTTIAGTNGGSYGILAQHGDVKLTDVTISGGAAGKAVIWVNRASSEVTGKNVTVQNTDYGVGGSAGSINIDGLTGNAAGRNVVADGASITLSNSTLGKTSAHNIKQTIGTLTLDTVTINGTTGGHGIMIEPDGVENEMDQPTVNLTGVTISGTAGDAIRNKGGMVTASNVTVKSAGGNGITNMIHNDGTTWASMTLTGSHIYGTTGREIENHNYLTIGDVLLGYGDGDTNGGILYQGTTTPIKLTSALRNSATQLLTIDAPDSVWVLGTNLVECANVDAAKAANDATTEASGKELHISAMDKYLQLTLEEGGNFYVQVVEDGTMYATINEAVAHIEGLATKKGTIKLLRDVTVSQTITINDGVDVKIIDNGKQCDIVRAKTGFDLITVNGGKLTMAGTADSARMKVDANYNKQVIAINGGEVALDKVDINNPQSNSYAIAITNVDTFTVKNSTIGGVDEAKRATRNINLDFASRANPTITLENVELLPVANRSIKMTDGTWILNDVEIQGAVDHGIIMEEGVPVLKMETVSIKDIGSSAIQNKNGIVIGTNVIIDGAKVGIRNESTKSPDANEYEGFEVLIDGLTILNTTTNGIEHAAGQMKITNSTISTASGNEILNKADLTIGNVKLGYVELGKDAQNAAIMDTNGGVLYQDSTTPVKVLDGYAFGNTAEKPMTITTPDAAWVVGTNLMECKDATAAQTALAGVKQSETAPYISVMEDGDDATTTCYLQLTTRKGGNFVAEVTDASGVVHGFYALDTAVNYIETNMGGKGTIVIVDSFTQTATVEIENGSEITVTDEGIAQTVTSAVATADANKQRPLFVVKTGAELTVNSTKNSGLTFAGSINETNLFNLDGGTLNVTNLDVTNVKGRVLMTTANGGTATINGGEIGTTWRSVQMYGGIVNLTDVTIGSTAGHNIKVEAGELNLNTVKINGTTSSGRGIMIEPPKAAAGVQPKVNLVNVEINGVASHGIQNKGGIVTGSIVKVTTPTGIGVLNAKHNDGLTVGSVKITNLTVQNATSYALENDCGVMEIDGGSLSNCNRNLQAVGGTTTLKGNLQLGATTGTNAYSIKVGAATVNLNNVDISEAASYGLIVEDAKAKVDLQDVTISVDAGTYAIYRKKGVVTGNNVTVTQGKAAIYSKEANTDANGPEISITNFKASGCTNNISVDIGEVVITNTDPAYTLGTTTDDNVSITGGTATLNGVTIEGSSTEGKYAVNNAATVTLANCTVNGPVNNTKTATITGGTYAGTVTNTDALTVNSGSFSGAVNNSGTLTVKGGTFSGAVDNTGTLNVTAGTFSGGVTNSSTATVSGATFTGGFTNSGTATLSGTSFSGGADGKAISTTGALTISNITVNGKLYVASAAVPVTYTGTTSTHTAEKPLVIVTDAASFVGGTNLVKCDDAAAATALAATFKAQDANGNLIPLVAQGECLALAAARYNGVAYATIEDAMDAARVTHPSFVYEALSTNDLRNGINNDPVELLSDMVLTEDLIVRYPLTVSSGYDITITDDGNARKIMRNTDFVYYAGLFRAYGDLSLTATTATDSASTLTVEADGAEHGNNSAIVTIYSGAEVNSNGVWYLNNKSNAYGSVFRNEAGTLTVNGGRFEGNTANNNTGGVIGAVANTTTIVKNAAFVNNKATKTKDGGGGAIITYGSLEIDGCTFTNNSSSKHGGAVLVGKPGTAEITNSSFSQNTATENGAAICTESNTAVNVTNCTFTSNAAKNSGGIQASGTVTVSGCQFNSNTATRAGGAIVSSATLTVKDGTTFTSNSSAQWGGAIFGDKTGMITITGGSFTGNQDTGADSHGGGAIYQWTGGKLTANGVTFSGNSAVGEGGAISVKTGSASAEIIDCTFESNSATLTGGAIYAQEERDVTVTNPTYGTGEKQNTANGVQNDINREVQ